MPIICFICGRDINAKGQENVSKDEYPLCEDCGLEEASKLIENFTTKDGIVVSKDDFEAFVKVQMSGITNMYARDLVCSYAGITEEVYKAIIGSGNYQTMKTLFKV